jgi:hypothetical protein
MSAAAIVVATLNFPTSFHFPLYACCHEDFLLPVFLLCPYDVQFISPDRPHAVVGVHIINISPNLTGMLLEKASSIYISRMLHLRLIAGVAAVDTSTLNRGNDVVGDPDRITYEYIP